MGSFESENKTFSKFCTELCYKDVILCDDMPFNLMPLEHMLFDMGIKTISFESGARAV